MKVMWIMLAILWAPAPLLAQSDQQQTQQLVKELKQLTDQAERDRSANYRFIDQLRDLTSRYDAPWRKQVLYDDFRDGDLTRNPVWHGDMDHFRIDRSGKLRSRLESRRQPLTQDKPRQSTEEAILGMLLEGVIQPGDRRAETQPTALSTQADISTAAQISNAFAITVEFGLHGLNRDGSFEWGPYQGRQRDSGYRIAYEGGDRPAIKVIRYRSGMSAVIDRYDQSNLLGDGKLHKINWLRSNSGVMTIQIDGKQIMRVRDRNYQDPFNGFIMTNRGGDYKIGSVSLFGEEPERVLRY